MDEDSIPLEPDDEQVVLGYTLTMENTVAYGTDDDGDYFQLVKAYDQATIADGFIGFMVTSESGVFLDRDGALLLINALVKLVNGEGA